MTLKKKRYNIGWLCTVVVSWHVNVRIREKGIFIVFRVFEILPLWLLTFIYGFRMHPSRRNHHHGNPLEEVGLSLDDARRPMIGSVILHLKLR